MKKPSTLTLMLLALLTSFSAFSIPVLNSHPSAQATIYLDFDGQVVESSAWNYGNVINAAPSGFNDDQITAMFNRVSEDYRPFNINITTDEAKFFAAPLTMRIRIIVTPTNYFRPNVGGSCYTGSFTWGDDTPGWVFSNALLGNIKWIAEACTHESGHSLGLSHQSKYDNTCQFVQTYHEGNGGGETSWAPVMGNSYYRNMTGWNIGPTPSGCAVQQDNLSIITTSNNFTYRPDDHTSIIDGAPTNIVVVNQSLTASGIITTTTDKDYFTVVNPLNNVFHLDVKPFSLGGLNDGANLDVKVTLFNSAKQIIRVYDPVSTLNVVVDTVLNAGTYYIMVDGTGNINVGDYGSLGSYSLTGTFSPISVTPIESITLTGNIDRSKHQLTWDIISSDPVKSISIELSVNGSSFKELVGVSTGAKAFAYNPFEKKDIYYRIKATSVHDQVAYSNTIVLKGTGNTNKITVSTFVHDELLVNSAEAYEFLLIDMNGRAISKGKRQAGINKENTSALPNGMYVLQIISNNERRTERIIKQ